ncbi:hypothetical protein [Pectobacterium sp. B2J-2]|uniref:hypothetical protein n=1 Tax=Pectobacterium sp. B2J-2 TaxID=3385372 RepID=UPI0038FCEEEE
MLGWTVAATSLFYAAIGQRAGASTDKTASPQIFLLLFSQARKNFLSPYESIGGNDDKFRHFSSFAAACLHVVYLRSLKVVYCAFRAKNKDTFMKPYIDHHTSTSSTGDDLPRYVLLISLVASYRCGLGSADTNSCLPGRGDTLRIASIMGMRTIQ